jgi:two-component system chemotaxis response regulator CheB
MRPVPPELIVCGASIGGLAAFEKLLVLLPADFSVPLVIVQHRGKEAGGLCDYLRHFCPLPITEPEDKEAIAPGRVYLAPGDYHLLVEKNRFALSTAAPVHAARPSINVLFESAADAYGRRAVGVILTGAGRDGATGLAQIKERGGVAVVQDPTTAEGRSLPEAALAAAHVDHTLALPQIAAYLAELCRPRGVRSHADGR